ncbi:hypothetical protein HDU67_003790, partial [Dinochytrium kinnereticum]
MTQEKATADETKDVKMEDAATALDKKAPVKKDDKKKEEDELSEEDQKLKTELEMLVERLK